MIYLVPMVHTWKNTFWPFASERVVQYSTDRCLQYTILWVYPQFILPKYCQCSKLPPQKVICSTPTRWTICECFLQKKGDGIIEMVRRLSGDILRTPEYSSHIWEYGILELRILAVRAVPTDEIPQYLQYTRSTEPWNTLMYREYPQHYRAPKHTVSPEVSAVLKNLETLRVLAVSAVHKLEILCEYTKYLQYFLSKILYTSRSSTLLPGAGSIWTIIQKMIPIVDLDRPRGSN